MQKKLILKILGFILTFITVSAFGQSTPTSSSKERIFMYEENTDSTVYRAMHQIMQANDPISYLSFFPKVNSVRRRFPLSEGTGRDGYLLEGVVDQRFTLARGRDGANHFFKSAELKFYFGYDLRMTMDESKPLIPANQRIGLELRKGLWNSFSKDYDFRANGLNSDTRNWYNTNKNLTFIYFTLLASHFSNGQSPGFYSDPLTRQHDYRGGDFSTNFFRLMLFKTNFNQKEISGKYKRNMFTTGFGLQWDFGTDGALAFSPEQNNSYGKYRLKGLFQWRSSPIKLWTHRKYTTSSEGNDYYLKELMEIRLRIEPDYITGNLSKFYNKPNELGQNYRFSNHTYIEFNPLRFRNIGLLLHHYYGRDYLNIRYDDIISTYQIGLTFNLSKYQPLNFRSTDAIARKKN